MLETIDELKKKNLEYIKKHGINCQDIEKKKKKIENEDYIKFENVTCFTPSGNNLVENILQFFFLKKNNFYFLYNFNI